MFTATVWVPVWVNRACLGVGTCERGTKSMWSIETCFLTEIQQNMRADERVCGMNN